MKFQLTLTLALVLGGAASSDAQAAEATGPSFSCAKASASDEKAICASDKLSELDRVLAAGYTLMLDRIGKNATNLVHLPHLRARQACDGDALCIFQQQVAELPAFVALDNDFELPSWLKISGARSYDQLKQSLKIGECDLTTVTSVSYRLCSPDKQGVCVPEPDSGSTIELADGIYGVSYDAVKAIEGSEFGDLVLACLSRVPTDCPKGDDRGYFWKSTNLRTGRSWELPDSEHMCGGA
jgi:hypothetical protein